MRSREGDLALVEAELLREVDDGWPLLADVLVPLVKAGEKRLGPMLVLEVVAALQDETEFTTRVIRAAAAMELLHLGSLVRDDVLDEGEIRRGVPTANARVGNLRAVLAGDVLFARSSSIAAELGQAHARVVARTLEALCRGQTLETALLFDVSRDEAAYFEAIEGKTAALMGACCEFGALEASPLASDALGALARFGRSLGVAFQLVDDVLDIVADAAETGKERGQDLCAGVYTLPVIRAMRVDPGLAGALGRPIDRRGAEILVERVLATTGVPSTIAVAAVYARHAVGELAILAASGIDIAALETIARCVLAPLDRLADEWRVDLAAASDRSLPSLPEPAH